MADEKNYFKELMDVDVSGHVEKKNGLDYLAWAFAWAEVKRHYQDATYTIYENRDGWNYFTDGKTCWVKTGVYGTTDQEETFEAHKFWQYDPIGQVNDDGSVTLEQFYIDAQKKGDYKPVYTGASPYKDIQ